MHFKNLIGLGMFVLLAATAACSATTADDNPGAPTEEDLGGARFTKKATPTNANLAALATAAKPFGGYLGTYRFNKPTTEATDAVARSKRIKEVMHRYMCSFFDESIDIAKSTTSAAVIRDIDLDDNNGDDKPTAPLKTALDKVLADATLETLSGSASGNNTSGEIMGVYDRTNNEILFFGFTNCGSDD